MNRKSIVAALGGEEGQHTLRILSLDEGDYELNWTPGDTGGVALAEREFDTAVKRGMQGYQSKAGVDELTKTFDPEADTIVVAPRVNGG